MKIIQCFLQERIFLDQDITVWLRQWEDNIIVYSMPTQIQKDLEENGRYT